MVSVVVPGVLPSLVAPGSAAALIPGWTGAVGPGPAAAAAVAWPDAAATGTRIAAAPKATAAIVDMLK
jgi:hypothetical protein